MRPCMIDGKQALFHGWNTYSNVIEPSLAIGGSLGGQIQYTLGMIEHTDGTMHEIATHKIRFTDSEQVFKQYMFDN